MEIKEIPFQVFDLENMTAEEHPGVTGKALWKTVSRGNVRIRIVEYAPGYLVADYADAHRSYTKDGVKLLIVD